MLKVVIYLNAILYCLVAGFLCINSFMRNSKVNWTVVAGVLLVMAYVHLRLIEECMDIGWSYLIMLPIFCVTEVLLIITIIRCLLSISTKTEGPSIRIALSIILIPVMLFVVSYSYELYRLNTCDYLVHFNYQNGIVISEDAYYAVTNHKPAKVTLENNLFNRKSKCEYKGVTTDIVGSIRFNKNGERKLDIFHEQGREYEQVFDKLGAVIYEANPNIDYIEIQYIPEANDAIVRMEAARYIFHDYKIAAKIKDPGSIRSIIVY